MPVTKPSVRKCPRCKGEMVPLEGIVRKGKPVIAHHCPTCDAGGMLGIWKRGNVIVGAK